jgi:hypothetical protein
VAKRKAPQVDPAAKLDEFAGAIGQRIINHNLKMEEDHGESIRTMPLIGPRLPHFCLRYAFRRNVMPFGRSYVVYGPEGSGKSSFLYWIYRLFVVSGGFYKHIELEDKDQPDLRVSVIGYPPHIDDRQWSHRAETINQYQQLYYQYCDWFKKHCEQLGVGRRVPYVTGIDALTSKLADNTLKAFVKNDGGVTQRFGEGANAIAQWLRMATNVLHGWPMAVVGVNHDKPKKDDYDNDVHQSPGGRSIGFHASTRIRVERVKYLPRTAEGVEGMLSQFTFDKNSASVTGQRFQAEFLWNASNATSDRPQESWWDFDKASIRLLADTLKNDNVKATQKEAIQDVLGLADATQGRFSCRALGVPKSDPLPPSELGRLLEQNEAVVGALEKVFDIRQGPEFRRGDDMADFMAMNAPDADVAAEGA